MNKIVTKQEAQQAKEDGFAVESRRDGGNWFRLGDRHTFNSDLEYRVVAE